MKVKAKSFEAWKVIMITLVFLSYCVGMMPVEKAQAVYDKYLDNGIFGMAFFFVLVGFEQEELSGISWKEAGDSVSALYDHADSIPDPRIVQPSRFTGN